MQKNYDMLAAVANWVLDMPHTREMGSSNQTGPSGSGTVVVASASVGMEIPVGVLLPKRNRMSLYELEELKMEYGVPDLMGLRLPTSTDVMRYPPKGCVMIFSAMYKYGLRLQLHPWVQMMLAKLGYASGQYNPNFWIVLHEVYTTWLLAKLGEPTFEQFMHLFSVSRQKGNFG
ncbi:unnamed protein product [Prunus armeniaca]